MVQPLFICDTGDVDSDLRIAAVGIQAMRNFRGKNKGLSGSDSVRMIFKIDGKLSLQNIIDMINSRTILKRTVRLQIFRFYCTGFKRKRSVIEIRWQTVFASVFSVIPLTGDIAANNLAKNAVAVLINLTTIRAVLPVHNL